MQLRYDWPDGTLKTIDWEVHRQALQTQPTRRTHFVKLCHNLLPTGTVLCTYGQGLPLCCTQCQAPNEDFEHVLRCLHLSRAKWRTSLLDGLKKKCHSLSTDPILTDILLDSLWGWLDQTNVHPLDYPIEYQTLLHKQTTIDWVQLFQGGITTSWQRMQHYHYSSLKPVKGRDGASWSRNILSYVFAKWYQLWKAQNKEVHGNDASTRAQSKHAQALQELEILYSLWEQVLQRGRSLYSESLEIHQQEST
jgi:hypothetical protein